MEYPLIIAGKHIHRNSFEGRSVFYPQYKFRISSANQLDIASAIGAVKKVERFSLSQRKKLLKILGTTFTVDDALVEHVVRMTGTPIRVIRDALDDVKRIFLETPEILDQRFKSHQSPACMNQEEITEEVISTHLSKLHHPIEGFCYAVTPGNDPRAAALVAANLGYLGIPFILRASSRDAVAAMIIKTMIDVGFDPNFCNLIYLDRDAVNYEQKHYKIVDECSSIWTFGQSRTIDQTLRYQINQRKLLLTLDNMEYDPTFPYSMKQMLEQLTESEFKQLVHIEPQKIDHFERKIVIRHESGNCAAILNGPFDETIMELLYPSIGYASICTAMRSIMILTEHDEVDAIAEMLSNLIVGDPLNPETQVGYIDARNLDYLSMLVQKNSLRLKPFGGERLTEHQANPLLITSGEDLPDFLGQEIPAYVLTAYTCQSIDEAVDRLNKYLDGNPRLGISLLRLTDDQKKYAISEINSRIVVINKPTTILLPAFHEGNDYSLLLTRGKMVLWDAE